jgi:hypothetical protein
MTSLFVEAYRVMYVYLMGDSRKNELYIAKYIDFFLSQFELREVRPYYMMLCVIYSKICIKIIMLYKCNIIFW